MTTPTTPAADVVSLRFRKKPVVIEASQWFKNGDHPLDYSRTHQGLENGQLRDFQPQERQANAWEGDIVRYYRTPSIDGKQACKHCGKIMHEHGWIDTLEGGHIVCPGDWIITGVAGEHYPCKPDIFAKTYEPAELATAGESALIAERDALRTQALTAPNLACKSAQARLATQWGYVRAASVEPVGRVARVEWCAHEQKWRHVIWADKKVPFGTPVFASAPPSPASVQNASLVEKLAKRTCEANADSARFTIALQTLRASLDPDDWMGAVTMHNYIDAVLAGGSPLQQHPAPSPAQAVDAVGESCAIFDSRGYYDWYDTEAQAKAWCDRYNARNVDDPLRPYTYVRLDALRAALQASRQPQAQQGGGENTARAFIEWCKAQPEDRVPVSIDEAPNEFEAALATKERS